GLFWYTGIAHYVIPYGVCMLGFFWMLRFLADGRWGYLLGCLIAMTYLGGAGYPEVVLAAMVFLIVLIATPIVHLHGKKDLRCVWLLLPFLSLLIGFAISAKAPGNRIRGGAEFGFHIDHAAATIGRALLAGWTDAIHYFIAVRPMMLFLILIIVCAWETLPVSDGCFCQKHPILILAGLYLIFSAIHAPELYVGEDVMAGISGGVYNSYFFVFTCCILLGTVTVTGWMKSVYQKKKSIKAQMLDTAVGSDRKKRPFAQWVRIPCLLMILLFCLVFRAHLIGGTTDYVAIEYIRSGQLADFRRQMKDRLEILENPSIRDAVLDPINDWQGPFMHFPVGDDPKSFVNLVTAEFYDKDSVVVRKD
ncbi:MAG: hypothetical protein IK096_02495, partial [Lachnospiraceae bacterium]|nr:hypothetical protein [Lachnospiraceae bacterium]